MGKLRPTTKSMLTLEGRSIPRRFDDGGLVPLNWPERVSPGPRYHTLFQDVLPQKAATIAGRIWGELPPWEPRKLHPMFQVMADAAHESPARAAEMCALLVRARLEITQEVYEDTPDSFGNNSELMPPRIAQSFGDMSSLHKSFPEAVRSYQERQRYHALRVLQTHFGERPNGLAAQQLLLPTSTLLGVVARAPTYYAWGTRVTTGEWSGYICPRGNLREVAFAEELTAVALDHKGYLCWDVAAQSEEEAGLVIGSIFAGRPKAFELRRILGEDLIYWIEVSVLLDLGWLSLDRPVTRTMVFQQAVKLHCV